MEEMKKEEEKKKAEPVEGIDFPSQEELYTEEN
jgi:hypothetical protein